MGQHDEKRALASVGAGVAPVESTACTRVQDGPDFDATCRADAALRLASACTVHPAGQAGVARQIGMTTPGAIKRFQRYCTGEKTAPVSVVEKLRLCSPMVFAAWMEGLRRDALPARPRSHVTRDEAMASIAKEGGEALSAMALRRPRAVQLKELGDAEEAIENAKCAVESER